MVVPWAATQLAGQDSEQSVSCCGLVGRRPELPCYIGSNRTKVGADLLAALGHGRRRWTAILGVNARR